LQRQGAQSVTLIQGSRGIFEIRSAGRVIYSKAKTGHFPTDAELNALSAELG
jgi:predicted Rdx family selenoprotein